jgi:dimethylargininase
VFTRAIVRPPGANFAAGITNAAEGAPDLDKALAQHLDYCDALRRCGVAVHATPPDDRFPDGTFVEDTAVICGNMAVITRPGAPTRQAEIEGLAPLLESFALSVHAITAPGTLDGGDICQVEEHFLIGLSRRTNVDGGSQLASILGRHGYSSSVIDIRDSRALLHLKSGLAYAGDRRLVAMAGLSLPAQLRGYEMLEAAPDEIYAANCVRINDHLLIAAGYPRLRARLDRLGYATIALEMSEFRKMDGGLSCLSLRL